MVDIGQYQIAYPVAAEVLRGPEREGPVGVGQAATTLLLVLAAA